LKDGYKAKHSFETKWRMAEIKDKWDGLYIIIRAERSKEYTTNTNTRDQNEMIISMIG
jgi:RNA polymerase subunit RPABC4/transcription elongation factor Spt4